MSHQANWPQVPLHQLAHIQTGLSKSASRGGPFVRRPYLRVANVQDGHLDLRNVKHIEVPVSQAARFELQEGDVLLTEGGDLDKLGRGTVWRAEIPGCVHQNHVFAVRVKDRAELLPEFLACEVQSAEARSYFLAAAKQTTNLASINSSQLKRLPIRVPDLAAQRSIVEACSAWDAAIRLADALHSIHARLHMERLNHLTSVGAAKYASQTFLRDATQELTQRNGANLDKQSVMAVTKHAGMRPMREGTIAANVTRYKTVPPQAFAYNPMRLNIGSIAMSPFHSNVLVSPDYVVFECDQLKLLPSYLNHVRQSRRWAKFFGDAGNGSVRVRIYYDDLAAFRLPLPPLPEQRRITRALDAAAQEVETLRRYADALKRQKRGLMQKLLTGEWRLPAKESAETADA